MRFPPMPAAPSDCDSLTADLVIADDQCGTTLLPADPQALAQFLAECRALEHPSKAPPNERNP
jgi:hypothetical protein